MTETAGCSSQPHPSLEQTLEGGPGVLTLEEAGGTVELIFMGNGDLKVMKLPVKNVRTDGSNIIKEIVMPDDLDELLATAESFPDMPSVQDWHAGERLKALAMESADVITTEYNELPKSAQESELPQPSHNVEVLETAFTLSDPKLGSVRGSRHKRHSANDSLQTLGLSTLFPEASGIVDLSMLGSLAIAAEPALQPAETQHLIQSTESNTLTESSKSIVDCQETVVVPVSGFSSGQIPSHDMEITPHGEEIPSHGVEIPSHGIKISTSDVEISELRSDAPQSAISLVPPNEQTDVTADILPSVEEPQVAQVSHVQDMTPATDPAPVRTTVRAILPKSSSTSNLDKEVSMNSVLSNFKEVPFELLLF